jgi:hypothetical protein
VKVVCLGLRFIVGEVKSLRLRELCVVDDFRAQGRLSVRFQCTRLGFGLWLIGVSRLVLRCAVLVSC